MIGTAGHVDHGKTTLVRALTGVDTDRWAEEKARGLTIDIGFAPVELEPEVETGLVDVPGHEDFLKNMLAGATGIDLLLLVVAADEGPMPQTLEHLAIARLLGVRSGVVALTKVDRVDEEWLELVSETTRDTLRAVLGRDDWPIVPVSAPAGLGLDALRDELRDRLAGVSRRPPDDLFRLPIDRSFSIRGTGTVVTGTVWSGGVSVGDELRVFPSGASARVRGLQVHDEPRQRVEAGRRCAAALVGPEPGSVPRGAVVVKGGAWRRMKALGARLRVLETFPRALDHDQRVRVYLGTREVMARALLPGGRKLHPGQTAWGALRLEDSIVARVGDRFVLRYYSPVTTLGGGQVAALDPPPGWVDRTDVWASILEGSPSEAVGAAVELASGAGISTEALPIVTGRSTGAVAEVCRAPPGEIFSAGDRWFTRAARDEARLALLEGLDRLHARHRRTADVPLSALRAVATGRYAPELIERALDDLVRERAIAVSGPGVRRSGHEARLTDDEAERMEILLRAVREGGSEPPTRSELGRRAGVQPELLQDLLVLLQREHRIVAITPDIFIAREVVEKLVATTRQLLRARATAPPTVFKDAFGVSRKYLIPILEYLDREGVTERIGEGRRLTG